MMSSADVTEAMAYEKIDPFQSQKIDYWAKCIMALLVNINASKANSVNPSRFAPPWERTKEKPKTLEDQVKEVFGVPPQKEG